MIKVNLFYKYLIYILLLFFLTDVILAGTAIPEITIDEVVKINKLPLGNYRLKVNGSLEIFNPSVVNNIYEFRMLIQLDSLIGISPLILDSTSKNFTFTQSFISYYLIKPKQRVKLGYFIYGIISEDIYDKVANSNSTFLEYYGDDFRLYSNVVVNLQKPQREGYGYEQAGDIPNKNITNVPVNSTKRLISSDIRNPTNYRYFISDLKLYGAKSSNPMYDPGTLLTTFNNITVEPYSLKIVDFFDPKSNDYSVYWVSYDLNIIQKTVRILKRIFDPVVSIPLLSNSTVNSTQKPLEPFIIKKSVDKTIIRSGDEFRVLLKIVNLNSVPVYNLTLEEDLPKDYEVKDVSTYIKIGNGTKLIFPITNIEAYDTKIVSYTLQNKGTIKGITYLKPAKLFHLNQTYYSDGVLLINDILADKKVFIQKEVEYIDDQYARVTIKVKNLGSLFLENILITDIIDENAIIKEISKVFQQRGVWRIKSLKPGEEWDVTYVIERNLKLKTLPIIYGIEKKNVYATLISSEEIVTIFQEQPKTIEKIGMGLAVGLLIFYLLF